MSMKYNSFILIFLINLSICVIVRGDLFEKDENGILLLNETNFQTAIDKYKTLITLIYIKEEQETNKVVKLIDDVGKKIQNEVIDATLAKLPLKYENTIFNKYSLDGTSGLLALMEHGERFVEYTQQLNDVGKIVEFMHKKVLEPITEINDINNLRLIIENKPCVSVGFFPNFTSTDFEEFRSSADWFYECDHFVTKNDTIFKYFNVESSIPTIKFFKECIHEVFDYPKQLPLDSNNILKYFLVCMEPDVSEYGMPWLTKRVFKQPQFALLLFVKKYDPKKELYIDIMKKYARRYREEINMAYIDVDGHEDVQSFLYTFDLKETDIPSIRAIETSNRYGNNTRKYKPKRKTINDASIRQFIGDVYYRQLTPYLISDKIPSDWNKDVIVTIVGDNFRNISEDPAKTVLIVFYNDEKKYETLVKGQLRQLATDFQTMGRSDIIIGKSNYYSNEYYGWHPNRFPKLILFPKGENRFGIEFQMEFTLEDIKIFVESDGQINSSENNKDIPKTVEELTVTVEDEDEGEINEQIISLNQENMTNERIEL